MISACEKAREQFQIVVRAKAEFDSVFDPIRVGAGLAPALRSAPDRSDGQAQGLPLQDAKRLREILRADIASLRDLVPPKEFRDLYASETLKLKAFFKEDILVPKLPPEVTREKLVEWKAMGFEMHYLPRIDMATKLDLETWTNKPGTPYATWGIPFVQDAETGKIEKVDGLTPLELSGAWMLVDMRQKPEYANGTQMYATQDMPDFFGRALKRLRRLKKIKRDNNTQNCPEDSRFGLSHDELSDPAIREVLRQAMKPTAKMTVRLPRVIEVNVLSHIHNLPWGNTNTLEWFEDHYDGEGRLFGGVPDYGGLSGMNAYSSGYRGDSLGFRLLGCFST